MLIHIKKEGPVEKSKPKISRNWTKSVKGWFLKKKNSLSKMSINSKGRTKNWQTLRCKLNNLNKELKRKIRKVISSILSWGRWLVTTIWMQGSWSLILASTRVFYRNMQVPHSFLRLIWRTNRFISLSKFRQGCNQNRAIGHFRDIQLLQGQTTTKMTP